VNYISQGDARFESAKWIVEAYHCSDRLDEIKVFTDHRHLMTVLADGGKTWDSSVTPPKFVGGQAYATLSLRPKASADISGGKVLHVTGEWDSHSGGRRWQDVFITPQGDALVQTNWAELILNPTLPKLYCNHIAFDGVLLRQFDASSLNREPRTRDRPVSERSLPEATSSSETLLT